MGAVCDRTHGAALCALNRRRAWDRVPHGARIGVQPTAVERAMATMAKRLLGGWMVAALLATLLVVTISGLKVYAIEEGRGPLASNTATVTLLSVAHAEDDAGDKTEETENQGEEFWEEIHEGATNFMLVLIAMHVLGVIVSSRAHKEQLIKAMINGKKSIK